MAELRGPMAHIVWEDDHLLMTHETGWRSRILVGGRGYGKNLTLKEWRRREAEGERWEKVRKDYYDTLIYGPRWAKSITWSCPRPTDPVYPIGSPGWMQAQASARLMGVMADDNRKLNAQIAAKVSAIHDILGVTPHGTNDPQVP